MSDEKNYQDNGEISLIDIWHFFQRQLAFIAVVVIATMALVLSYGITRPTVWQSNVSLVVGEKYFLQQQSQIESFEEIKYKYSKNVVISPIKNTRIIEIAAPAPSKEQSLENINAVVTEILKGHKQIADEKRAEFDAMLRSLGFDKTPSVDLIKMLDSGSSITPTRQLGVVSTEEKLYGGLLQKIVGLGVVLSVFLALLLALVRDIWARKSAAD